MEGICHWIQTIVSNTSDNNPIDVRNVCELLTNKKLSIDEVVVDLGPFLTNIETNERLKGMNILSKILYSLPNDFLSSKEVEHLTRFYCDRLKDHYSVIPDVFSGLIAIVDSLNFDQNLPQMIFNGLVKEISVQQYSVSQRFLVFQLLSKLIDKYIEEFKAIRPQFIYGLIQLIEGERDPRCLILVFKLTKSVIKAIDLDPYTEDVFEVISCYFPVLFTPPPNDDYGITKEDLSEALHNCFIYSSDFSEFLFPLVLEKLESELLNAKIDSYKVIESVCPNYGFEKIEEYIPQLWTSIRIDALKPKLLESEVSEFALKALSSISDTIMASNESNMNSFIELIWNDISNAFNKPELDLMESAVDILLATINSNVYSFNRLVAQSIPVLLKQFTFCQKDSTRLMIIESLSRILSHSRKLSQKHEINLINSESMFTLLTSISIAETESDDLREAVISCLQHLIELIQMKANHWKIVSHVLRSLLNNCFNSKKLLSKTYSLMESITSLNRIVIENQIQTLIENFDSDYSTEANQKRLNRTLNAFEFVSTDFEIFQLITAHLVEEIKSNSYYTNENQEFYSLLLTKTLFKCISKQSKFKFEEKVNSFLYNECLDPLIQHCIHVSICTDNKSGTIVNMKLMNNLFAVIGKTVSKLNFEYNQQLFDKLSQFSIFGKVDKLLPVVPPTCFCTYVMGPKFLETLSDTQALIVFGLTDALISNLNYVCEPQVMIELFDKLFVFAITNRYNNLNISQSAAKSIGALVNKFDAKNEVLNERLKQLLALFENRLKDSDESEETELLITALVWITKGLVIGGHLMRKDFIALLISLLEHKNNIIRNEVSKAFALIHISDDCCLTRDNNAIVRILYNQSFFLETFDSLLSGYSKYKSENLNKKQTFLTALLTQLNFIPKAVFRNQLNKLLPMLLDAIRSDSSTDNQTAALDAINQILIDKMGQIFDPSLKSTVDNCVNLALNSPKLKVRRSALNCLAQIANTFDDSILNHLRDEVVKNLRKTLNDKKRVVRKSAVKARCKWILVGQPGK